jgi:hypothetical protein
VCTLDSCWEIRIAQVTNRVYRFRCDLRHTLWLLKNYFGVFPQKTRPARMAYTRFSPARDTVLVTQFRQFLALKGLFQQPPLFSPKMYSAKHKRFGIRRLPRI